MIKKEKNKILLIISSVQPQFNVFKKKISKNTKKQDSQCRIIRIIVKILNQKVITDIGEEIRLYFKLKKVQLRKIWIRKKVNLIKMLWF